MADLPAIMVANTFISRYGQEGSLDHLKLQKLIYYAYGWWLASCPQDMPLVSVKPQMWKLGPIFNPVYGAFAGSKHSTDLTVKKVGPFLGPDFVETDDSKESRQIDWIWQRYGGYTSVELSDMAHEPGTPWYTIAQQHDFRVPRFFEMDDIANREYFTDLAIKEGLVSLV